MTSGIPRYAVGTPSTPAPLARLQMAAIPILAALPSSVTRKTPRQRPLSSYEKLEKVLDLLDSLSLTIGDLLSLLFTCPPPNLQDGNPKSKPSQPVPTQRFYQKISAFLRGRSSRTPIQIIKLIYEHPYSKPKRESPERGLHFSTTSPAVTIKHARPALSTWAAELVTEHLVYETSILAHKNSGLHITARSARSGSKIGLTSAAASWERVHQASSSSSWLENLFRTKAPLLWHSLISMLEYSPRRQQKDYTGRYSPTKLTAIGAISAIVFGSNRRASLYQFSNSIWLFATRASYHVYRVLSRRGWALVYQSVLNGLSNLSRRTMEEFRDTVRSGKKKTRLVLDNVQTYHKRREKGIGRTDKMHVGTAATAIVLENIAEGALKDENWDRKASQIGLATLTTQDLWEEIDHEHWDRVASLHWLQILVDYVPSLAPFRPWVALQFAEGAKKAPMAKGRTTEIHPLGTNDANEATLSGMKEAIHDFVTIQLGLGPEELKNEVFIASGDGMTFNNMLRLKKNMEASTDDHYRSFRWLLPLLEVWHTVWTDLSRLASAHWGENASRDPATLWHSATAIGHSTPSNLKKVEWNSTSRTVDMVLVAHVLDCWRVHLNCGKDIIGHFQGLSFKGRLPPEEDLLQQARKLHRQYSTSSAYRRALVDPSFFPQGKTWVQPNSEWDSESSEEGSAADTELSDEEGRSKKKKKGHDLRVFERNWAATEAGTTEDTRDTSLANAINFMRDAMLHREAVCAVADGDMGRVLNIFSIWIFSFSGSGNRNYTQYLLHIWAMFKWELKAPLAEAIKQNMLVNLRGVPGHTHAGDMMQEHQNRLLEEFVQHKGSEFSDKHIRDGLAPNIHHLQRIKDELEKDAGLEEHTKKHSGPSRETEIRRLLDIYWDEELHRHRKGRSLGRLTADQINEGYRRLDGGQLTKFIDLNIGQGESEDEGGDPEAESCVPTEAARDAGDEDNVETSDMALEPQGINVEDPSAWPIATSLIEDHSDSTSSDCSIAGPNEGVGEESADEQAAEETGDYVSQGTGDDSD